MVVARDLGEAIEVDAIVVTAGATHVPDAFEVPEAGRAHGAAASRHGDHGDGVQRLTVVEIVGGRHVEQTFDAVRFVPLLPGLA
jgi:protein-L-isoaspartate O-methyltransferase